MRVATSLACGLLVLVCLARSEFATAFHPNDALELALKWEDFLPSGDRHLMYNLNSCSGAVSPQWGPAVEDWDSLLGSNFEFDGETGCTPRDATLQWGSYTNCGAGAYACTHTLSTLATNYRKITHADIYFTPNYPPLTIPWKTANSAHEWGHVIGLEDDTSAQCGAQSIMGQIELVGDPCYTSPNAADVSSVQCYNVNSDCDGDGYNDWMESFVGTSNRARCQPGDTPGDTPKPSGGWPSDLSANGDFSRDRANIADLGSFIVPVRRIGTSPGPTNYDARWDLFPGSPFGAYINLQDMATIIAGPTGFPPMFNGARAFGHANPCTAHPLYLDLHGYVRPP